MKRPNILAYLGSILLCAGAAALAPDGGSFDLSWHSMDGGGGTSNSRAFALSGTIGQPDAGVVMTGGDFALTGGFWAAPGGGPVCPEDINGDGVINVTDLLAVLSAWGACPVPPALCPEDINGDGFVNVTDLLAVLSAWGPCE